MTRKIKISDTELLLVYMKITEYHTDLSELDMALWINTYVMNEVGRVMNKFSNQIAIILRVNINMCRYVLGKYEKWEFHEFRLSTLLVNWYFTSSLANYNSNTHSYRIKFPEHISGPLQMSIR